MKKQIFIAFFIAVSGGIFTSGFSTMGKPAVALAEESVDDLEEEAEKLEKKLKAAEKKSGVIQQDLNQINSSLTSTQQLIQKVQLLLNQTEQTIGQKTKEIANLENQLTLERHVLRGLLQEMYFAGDTSLAGIVLAENDLLGVFQANDNLFSTQEKMQEVIREITEMRTKVKDEKVSLEDTKSDHAQLLTIKNNQKLALVSEKIETQDDLDDQQTIINRLKKELAELQGDLSVLTGKSYNAKDIREAVEYASDETGVPQGVLYGFLKMETNLGANTGQCTYKEVEKVSVARYKKYGKKYQASINLLYKRRDMFYDIVDKLGYSKTKKVSCSPNYIGQGGAMGVSQFMSDVWNGYAAQIASKTGHKNPDPWNLTDGVMAMGLKLKKAGATSDSTTAIRKASISYLGAFNKGYYNGIVYWSKNYKSLFK